MNPDSVLDEVRRVADAVMYEGYVLYPYRASAQKNRSRWQFGVLMPPAYVSADPSERSSVTAECVLTCCRSVSVEVTARFLHVQRRTGPDAGGAGAGVWDEAVEREVTVTAAGGPLFNDGVAMPFTISGGADRDGDVTRTRRPLTGTVLARAAELPGPWRAARLTVTVANETSAEGTWSGDGPSSGRRDEALPFALVAAHMIITVSGGAFVSLTDPPEWAAAFAGECENAGCWPVLAGPEGSRSTVLASTIILPDHPSVARESAGELYDGTEIDEILTLRTLALTDAEKAAARDTDPRAAALIDRVEALSADGDALGRLHGTFRSPGDAVPPPDPGTGDVPWWDPEADASVSPDTDSVLVAGRPVARGSRVTLRPGAGQPGGRRADAQDMFLAGREALVEAVLRDVDEVAYLAVSLADDPAADMQAAHGRFLYFMPDEVEPC
jgi:hypothetical protein